MYISEGTFEMMVWLESSHIEPCSGEGSPENFHTTHSMAASRNAPSMKTRRRDRKKHVTVNLEIFIVKIFS